MKGFSTSPFQRFGDGGGLNFDIPLKGFRETFSQNAQ
jgi:hypothetical protein